MKWGRKWKVGKVEEGVGEVGRKWVVGELRFLLVL